MLGLTKKTEEQIKEGAWIPKVLTPAILIIVLNIAVQLSAYIKDLEARSLDSPEIKYRLQEHMKVWTPENQRMAFERLEDVEKATVRFGIADSLADEERKELKRILKRIENKIDEQLN